MDKQTSDAIAGLADLRQRILAEPHEALITNDMFRERAQRPDALAIQAGIDLLTRYSTAIIQVRNNALAVPELRNWAKVALLCRDALKPATEPS